MVAHIVEKSVKEMALSTAPLATTAPLPKKCIFALQGSFVLTSLSPIQISIARVAKKGQKR